MDDSTEAVSSRRRAAQYVRMSTEHQQYSTSNQEDAIREYANRRGFEIVRTYADEGKSGLTVAGREQLRRLIDDVQNGRADYSAILVYDVSRWGRFQDADESAYYEYLCKRAGIEVHYCAEQFENDGGPTSTIIKSVKRAMAGEYSRELSSKVFKGQCRLIELGYRQGGMPGFGLRRMLINQAGQPKGMLARGEQKSLQTDRVVLVPGPEDEVRVVRTIYNEFTRKGKREAEIAAELNAKGLVTDFGASLDAGDHPSGARQREIHRQQRLQPDIVQAQTETRPEPGRYVGPRRPRLRAAGVPRGFFHGTWNLPGASAAAM